MDFKAFFQLLRDTWTAWNEDRAPRLGAALSYYTVFSLSPMLLLLISLLSIFYNREAATGEITRQLQGTIGRAAAEAVNQMIAHADKGDGKGSLIASIVGFVTVLLGAGGLFGQLQDSLNTIWGVRPKPNLGWTFMLRTRFVSFAMVLGVGFMLLVSLALSAALSALSKWMSGYMGDNAVIGQILNLGIGFFIITLLFAAIYKVLPDAEIQWHDVWIGAAVTSFLFSLGKFGLGMYLGRPGVESTYGSAGALVILLLWVYYASQILFFGAEFTKVYANRFGSKIVPSPHAEAVTEDMRANQGMVVHPTHGAAEGSPGQGSGKSPQGAVLTATEVVRPNKPEVSKEQRQVFEHSLAVVAGAIITVAWFLKRSQKEEIEI